MGITERMQSRTPMLMEAALGERLKSEYHLVPDEQVALCQAPLSVRRSGRH